VQIVLLLPVLPVLPVLLLLEVEVMPAVVLKKNKEIS
jgi:hypothetical protein